MEKDSIKKIVNDLKAKRDALSLAHEQLKKDNDNWNKCIIVLSLATGMIESAKIKMGWDGNGVALIPIFMSSTIASISALIKFKKFPEQMETLIQAISLLTNTLNKCRNHSDIDSELLIEYNNALEQLETSVYPDIRRKYLKISHKNLIDIMKIEDKYFKNIDMVNTGGNTGGNTDEESIKKNKGLDRYLPTNLLNSRQSSISSNDVEMPVIQKNTLSNDILFPEINHTVSSNEPTINILSNDHNITISMEPLDVSQTIF